RNLPSRSCRVPALKNSRGVDGGGASGAVGAGVAAAGRSAIMVKKRAREIRKSNDEIRKKLERLTSDALDLQVFIFSARPILAVPSSNIPNFWRSDIIKSPGYPPPSRRLVPIKDSVTNRTNAAAMGR